MKNTGAVITDDTNEFVWVPVKNIHEMAKLQSNSTTNYQGVLYDFEGTTYTEMSNYGLGTKNYREPDELTDIASIEYSALNFINNTLGKTYMQSSEFKADLQKDFNEMVKSVEKYKGFYVGRYEISLDLTSKIAYSRKGVFPATASEDSADKWFGFYAYQRKMSMSHGYTSVDSHMIWGCNYDAMLRWILTGNDAEKVTTIGNAVHDSGTIHETGKSSIEGKEDKMNNIYDLEGNLYEWTAEAYNTDRRTGRGGNFNFKHSPSLRFSDNPYSPYNGHSSRPILYINL